MSQFASSFYNTYYMIGIINLILGIVIFSVSFCRVVVSSKEVIGRVRFKFVALGPAALAVGVSPIWGNLPSVWDVIFMASVAAAILSESYQWHHGPPLSVKEETMPPDVKAGFHSSWIYRITKMFTESP